MAVDLGRLILHAGFNGIELRAGLAESKRLAKATQVEIQSILSQPLKWGLTAGLDRELESVRFVTALGLGKIQKEISDNPLKIKVEGAAIDLGPIEKKLQALNKQSVKVGVNLAPLHELNRVLDKKQQHIKETERVFTAGFDRIGASADKLAAKIANLNELQANASISSRGQAVEIRQKVILSGDLAKQIADAIEKGFKEAKTGNLSGSLGGQISKAVEDGFKNAKPSSLLQGLGKITKGITAPIRTIGVGVLEGVGREASRNFSKSLADSLAINASGSIGSASLLGEKLGNAISSGLAGKLGTSLKNQIQRELRDAIGGADIDREAGIIALKRQQKKTKGDRQGAEGLNIQRQGVERERIGIANEYAQNEKTLNIVSAKRDRINSVIDRQSSSLFNARESGNKPLESYIERQILEAKLLRSELESLSADLSASNAELRGKVEKLYNKRQSLTESINSLQPQQSPALREIAEAAAGRKLKDDEIPQVVASDAVLEKLGGTASYNPYANTVSVTSGLKEQIDKNQISKQGYLELTHETRHGDDAGFGSIQGIQAFTSGQLLRPRQYTAGEVAYAAPYVAQYEPRKQAQELSAYAAEHSIALPLYEKVQKRRNLDSFNERYGFAGNTFTKYNKVSAAKTQALNAGDPRYSKIISSIEASGQRVQGDIYRAVGKGELDADLPSKIKQQVALMEALQGKIENYRRENPFGSAPAKYATDQLARPFNPSKDPWDDIPKPELRGVRSSPFVSSGIQRTNRIKRGAGGSRAVEAELLRDPPDFSATLAQVSTALGSMATMAGKVIRPVTGAAVATFRFAQGVESAVLPLVPFGKEIKGIGQSVGLPMLAYGGLGMLPGGQVAQGVLGAGAKGLLSLPGSAIGGALTTGASEALSGIPMLGGGLSSAVTAMIGGAIDTGIAALTPVLAGKAILGLGGQASRFALPAASGFKALSAGKDLTTKAIDGTKSLFGTTISPLQSLPPARSPIALPASSPNTPALEGKSRRLALPGTSAATTSEIQKFEYSIDQPIEILPAAGMARIKKATERISRGYNSIINQLKKGNEEKARYIATELEKGTTRLIAEAKVLMDEAGQYTPEGQEIINFMAQLGRKRKLAQEQLRKIEQVKEDSETLPGEDSFLLRKKSVFGKQFTRSKSNDDYFESLNLFSNKEESVKAYENYKTEKRTTKVERPVAKAYKEKELAASAILKEQDAQKKRKLVEEFLSKKPEVGIGISNKDFLAGKIDEDIKAGAALYKQKKEELESARIRLNYSKKTQGISEADAIKADVQIAAAQKDLESLEARNKSNKSLYEASSAKPIAKIRQERADRQKRMQQAKANRQKQQAASFPDLPASPAIEEIIIPPAPGVTGQGLENIKVPESATARTLRAMEKARADRLKALQAKANQGKQQAASFPDLPDPWEVAPPKRKLPNNRRSALPDPWFLPPQLYPPTFRSRGETSPYSAARDPWEVRTGVQPVVPQQSRLGITPPSGSTNAPPGGPPKPPRKPPGSPPGGVPDGQPSGPQKRPVPSPLEKATAKAEGLKARASNFDVVAEAIEATIKNQEILNKVAAGESLTAKPVEKLKDGILSLAGAGVKAIGVFAGFQIGTMIATQFGEAIVNTVKLAGEFEQLEIKLQAAVGGLVSGSQKMADIRQEAKSLNISQTGAIELGTRLAATTQGTALEGLPTDILRKQSLSVFQARGLSVQEQRGFAVATGQILGSKRLATEELNQLRESGGIVDARQIGAQALGLSPQQFSKQLESKDGIDSQKFIQSFLSQASANALVTKDTVAGTQQAKVQGLTTSIENFQVTIGKGLNPVFKAGLDLLTGAMQLLQIAVEAGGKMLIGFAIASIPMVITALWNLGKASIAAMAGMENLSGKFKSLALSIGGKVGAIAAIYALGEAFNFYSDALKDAGEETIQEVNKIQSAIERLGNQEIKIKLPRDARDIGGTDWVNGIFLGLTRLTNDVVGGITGAKFVDPREVKEGERTRALGKASNQVTDYGPVVQVAAQASEKIDKLDLQRQSVLTRRSALFANNPDDLEGIRALDLEEKGLVAEITRAKSGLDESKAIIQRQKNLLIGEQEKLEKRKATGQTTESGAARDQAIISKALKEIEAYEDTLNNATRTPLDNLTLYSQQLDKIGAKYEAITTKAQQLANADSRDYSKGIINDSITPGQADYLSATSELRILSAQINESVRVTALLVTQINSIEPSRVATLLSLYGLSRDSAPAEVSAAANSSSDPRDKRDLEAIQKVREQEIAIDQLRTSFDDKRKALAQKLRDENKGIVDYYRQLAQSFDKDDAKKQSLLSQLEVARNKFQENISRLGNSLADGFLGAITDLLKSADDKIKAETERIRAIKKAQLDYQNATYDLKFKARGTSTGTTIGEAEPLSDIAAPLAGQSIPELAAKNINPVERFRADRMRSGRVVKGGHEGTDYPAPAGSPVFASFSGKARIEDWRQSGKEYGYAVVTAFTDAAGREVVNRRAHLTPADVIKFTGARPGSGTVDIRAGQQIGTVQDLGDGFNRLNGSRNHVHDEIRVGGQLVDARQYLLEAEKRARARKTKANLSPISATGSRAGVPNANGVDPNLLRSTLDYIGNIESQGNYYAKNDGGSFPASEAAVGFPASQSFKQPVRTSKGTEYFYPNVGKYQFSIQDYRWAQRLDPSIRDFTPSNQDKIAKLKLFKGDRGGRELLRYQQQPTLENADVLRRELGNEWEAFRDGKGPLYKGTDRRTDYWNRGGNSTQKFNDQLLRTLKRADAGSDTLLATGDIPSDDSGRGILYSQSLEEKKNASIDAFKNSPIPTVKPSGQTRKKRATINRTKRNVITEVIKKRKKQTQRKIAAPSFAENLDSPVASQIELPPGSNTQPSIENPQGQTDNLLNDAERILREKRDLDVAAANQARDVNISGADLSREQAGARIRDEADALGRSINETLTRATRKIRDQQIPSTVSGGQEREFNTLLDQEQDDRFSATEKRQEVSRAITKVKIAIATLRSRSNRTRIEDQALAQSQFVLEQLELTYGALIRSQREEDPTAQLARKRLYDSQLTTARDTAVDERRKIDEGGLAFDQVGLQLLEESDKVAAPFRDDLTMKLQREHDLNQEAAGRSNKLTELDREKRKYYGNDEVREPNAVIGIKITEYQDALKKLRTREQLSADRSYYRGQQSSLVERKKRSRIDPTVMYGDTEESSARSAETNLIQIEADSRRRQALELALSNSQALFALNQREALIIAESEQKLALINERYNNQINTRERERTTYQVEQKLTTRTSNLSVVQGQLDQRQKFGFESNAIEYGVAVESQKIDYERQRQGLQDQKAAITATDKASIAARANIQLLIDNLDKLNAIKLEGLAQSFDPLNQALQSVQKQTRSVAEEFVKTGKINWQSILVSGIDVLLGRTLDKLITSAFSGLYRSGAAAGSNPAQGAGGSVGGILGTLLGGLLGFADGGEIMPRVEDMQLSLGSSAIAKGLRAESAKSGRRATLIYASEGERMLSAEQNRLYNAIHPEGIERVRGYAYGGDIGKLPAQSKPLLQLGERKERGTAIALPKRSIPGLAQSISNISTSSVSSSITINNNGGQVDSENDGSAIGQILSQVIVEKVLDLQRQGLIPRSN